MSQGTNTIEGRKVYRDPQLIYDAPGIEIEKRGGFFGNIRDSNVMRRLSFRKSEDPQLSHQRLLSNRNSSKVYKISDTYGEKNGSASRRSLSANSVLSNGGEENDDGSLIGNRKRRNHSADNKDRMKLANEEINIHKTNNQSNNYNLQRRSQRSDSNANSHVEQKLVSSAKQQSRYIKSGRPLHDETWEKRKGAVSSFKTGHDASTVEPYISKLRRNNDNASEGYPSLKESRYSLGRKSPAPSIPSTLSSPSTCSTLTPPTPPPLPKHLPANRQQKMSSLKMFTSLKNMGRRSSDSSYAGTSVSNDSNAGFRDPFDDTKTYSRSEILSRFTNESNGYASDNKRTLFNSDYSKSDTFQYNSSNYNQKNSTSSKLSSSSGSNSSSSYSFQSSNSDSSNANTLERRSKYKPSVTSVEGYRNMLSKVNNSKMQRQRSSSRTPTPSFNFPELQPSVSPVAVAHVHSLNSVKDDTLVKNENKNKSGLMSQADLSGQINKSSDILNGSRQNSTSLYIDAILKRSTPSTNFEGSHVSSKKSQGNTETHLEKSGNRASSKPDTVSTVANEEKRITSNVRETDKGITYAINFVKMDEEDKSEQTQRNSVGLKNLTDNNGSKYDIKKFELPNNKCDDNQFDTIKKLLSRSPKTSDLKDFEGNKESEISIYVDDQRKLPSLMNSMNSLTTDVNSENNVTINHTSLNVNNTNVNQSYFHIGSNDEHIIEMQNSNCKNENTTTIITINQCKSDAKLLNGENINAKASTGVTSIKNVTSVSDRSTLQCEPKQSTPYLQDGRGNSKKTTQDSDCNGSRRNISGKLLTGKSKITGINTIYRSPTIVEVRPSGSTLANYRERGGDTIPFMELKPPAANHTNTITGKVSEPTINDSSTEVKSNSNSMTMLNTKSSAKLTSPGFTVAKTSMVDKDSKSILEKPHVDSNFTSTAVRANTTSGEDTHLVGPNLINIENGINMKLNGEAKPIVSNFIQSTNKNDAEKPTEAINPILLMREFGPNTPKATLVRKHSRGGRNINGTVKNKGEKRTMASNIQTALIQTSAVKDLSKDKVTDFSSKIVSAKSSKEIVELVKKTNQGRYFTSRKVSYSNL